MSATTTKALQVIAQHLNSYLYELRVRGCEQAAKVIQQELNQALQALSESHKPTDTAPDNETQVPGSCQPTDTAP
jgi:hypothetical protein